MKKHACYVVILIVSFIIITNTIKKIRLTKHVNCGEFIIVLLETYNSTYGEYPQSIESLGLPEEIKLQIELNEKCSGERWIYFRFEDSNDFMIDRGNVFYNSTNQQWSFRTR